MQKISSKKLTFENIVAAAAPTSIEQRIDAAPESEISEVRKCFLDVWDKLRTEYTTEQLREPMSSELPRIKSNIRKTINTSDISNTYKKLLINDIENTTTSIELLDKINRLLRKH